MKKVSMFSVRHRLNLLLQKMKVLPNEGAGRIIHKLSVLQEPEGIRREAKAAQKQLVLKVGKAFDFHAPSYPAPFDSTTGS